MRGVIGESMPAQPYVSELIPHFVGESTIRMSPLVVEVLGNSTASRNDSVYLLTETQTSFTNCGPDMTSANAWIYGNDYMRQNLAEVVAHTSYNLTFLTEMELIVPVVDCTSGAIIFGDQSVMRVFFLMRPKTNHDDVHMLTWSLMGEDYQLADEHQFGASGAIALTYNNNVRDTIVTYHHVMRLGFPYQMSVSEPYTFLQIDAQSFWQLESIPRDASTEATHPDSSTNRFLRQRRDGAGQRRQPHAESGNQRTGRDAVLWLVRIRTSARLVGVGPRHPFFLRTRHADELGLHDGRHLPQRAQGQDLDRRRVRLHLVDDRPSSGSRTSQFSNQWLLDDHGVLSVGRQCIERLGAHFHVPEIIHADLLTLTWDWRRS